MFIVLALWLYEKRRASMALFRCSSTYYFRLYVTVSIYYKNRKSFLKIVCFRFPEIIAELIKKPKDDSYPELNIWSAKKG
jgi:hypothetical protein